MVRRWIGWMAPRNKTSLGQMTTIELLDARREPEPVARIADQQQGCSAGGRRRWRRQHVVDLEVPVRGERNRVRIAFDEWGNVFTNECGEDRDAGRRNGGCQYEGSPKSVALCEHEASAADGD